MDDSETSISAAGMSALDNAVRRVIHKHFLQVGTPALRAAALAVISDSYHNEAATIRAQQYWRDEVMKEYRAALHGG